MISLVDFKTNRKHVNKYRARQKRTNNVSAVQVENHRMARFFWFTGTVYKRHRKWKCSVGYAPTQNVHSYHHYPVYGCSNSLIYGNNGRRGYLPVVCSSSFESLPWFLWRTIRCKFPKQQSSNALHEFTIPWCIRRACCRVIYIFTIGVQFYDRYVILIYNVTGHWLPI